MSKIFRNVGAMCEWNAFADKLSTNTYADVGIWAVGFFKTKIFTFSAVTNNLHVKTLGSRDGGSTFTAIDTDTLITVGTPTTATYTDAYTHIKVQVKAAVGGSQGTLSTKYFGTWI